MRGHFGFLDLLQRVLQLLHAGGIALDRHGIDQLLVEDRAIILILGQPVEFGGRLILDVLGIEEGVRGSLQVGIARPFFCRRLKLDHRFVKLATLGQQPGLAEAETTLQLDGVDQRERLGRIEVVRDFLDVGDLTFDLLELADFQLILQHGQLGEEEANFFLFVAGQALQRRMEFVAEKGLLQLLGRRGNLSFSCLVFENIDGLGDAMVDL